MRTASYKL